MSFTNHFFPISYCRYKGMIPFQLLTVCSLAAVSALTLVVAMTNMMTKDSFVGTCCVLCRLWLARSVASLSTK